MSQVPDTIDVFVIGGGPAGLAAAIAARERGFRVLVADGVQPPIDKACGEGLLPDGRVALERLGFTCPLPSLIPSAAFVLLATGCRRMLDFRRTATASPCAALPYIT